MYIYIQKDYEILKNTKKEYILKIFKRVLVFCEKEEYYGKQKINGIIH